MVALGRHLQENLSLTRSEVRKLGETAWESLAPDGQISFEELKEIYGVGSGGSVVKGCGALLSIVCASVISRLLA